MKLRLSYDKNNNEWIGSTAPPTTIIRSSDQLYVYRTMLKHLGVTTNDTELVGSTFIAGLYECYEIRNYQGQTHDLCPECHGTGKYIGLNVVEPCKTCQNTRM